VTCGSSEPWATVGDRPCHARARPLWHGPSADRRPPDKGGRGMSVVVVALPIARCSRPLRFIQHRAMAIIAATDGSSRGNPGPGGWA